MFNLERLGVYHWNNIFILLSWAGFEPYLPEIQFPFLSHIQQIHPIAQEFTADFYRIDRHPHIGKTLSQTAQQVFDRAYQQLTLELGETNTKLFCEWGNQLDLPHQLDYALYFIVDNILTYKRLKADFTTLPAKAQQILQSLIQNYHEDTGRLIQGIDVLDEALNEDEYGKTILFRYKLPPFQDGTPDDLYVSPVDTLGVWIDDFRQMSLLRAIKAALSEEELQALNQAVRTHSDWVRVHESPNRQTHPVDLLQLLDQL